MIKKLVLIDGHAILHRAFHAYPPLTTSKGEVVGAVYGFFNILLTTLRDLAPEYVAIAFDKKGPTFRHIEYKEYKAKRPKMDKSLETQIPRVKEVVETLGIPIFEAEGFEADDVIGTLAFQAKVPKVKSIEIIIVTGDQDALQLVDKNVEVYMPARGKIPAKIYDKEAILEKYGLEPRQLVDLKALAGDPSDEIPGVSGIGPKTAVKLLQKFSTAEGIYRGLGVKPNRKAVTLKAQRSTEGTKKSLWSQKYLVTSVLQKSIRNKLLAGIDSARLSKKLAKIVTDVPIKLDLEKCRLEKYDKAKALKLFKELEFKSLIKKLPEDGWEKMVLKTMGKEQKVRDKPKGVDQIELF